MRLPTVPPVPQRNVADEPLTFVESSLIARLNGRQSTLQEILALRTVARARARQLNTTASAGHGSLGRYGQ